MEPTSDIRLRQSRKETGDTQESTPISLIPQRRKSGSRSPPSGRASPETPPLLYTVLNRDEQWQHDYHTHQQSGLPVQPLSKVR